jgi:G3E family GTPase
MLPIFILTGFLGSGKTTLLNRFLNNEKLQNTVVIVNEFGDVGIDHLLVRAKTDDLIMLAGGCLCCKVRGDLLDTLEMLYKQRENGEIPKFERVLIETSGLAAPAPILRTLLSDEFIREHFQIAQLIATVDGIYGFKHLKRHEESAQQIALSNYLILTKTDVSKPKAILKLKERLKNLNPSAHIFESSQDFNELFENDNKEDFFQIQNLENHPHNSNQDIQSFVIEYDQPIEWKTMGQWIQQLTRLRGQDLLRIKGLVYTQEYELPMIIQGVQHVFQKPTTLETWPFHPPKTQLVFITRHIPKQMIEKSFHAILNARNPIERCQAASILLEIT